MFFLYGLLDLLAFHLFYGPTVGRRLDGLTVLGSGAGSWGIQDVLLSHTVKPKVQSHPGLDILTLSLIDVRENLAFRMVEQEMLLQESKRKWLGIHLRDDRPHL